MQTIFAGPQNEQPHRSRAQAMERSNDTPPSLLQELLASSLVHGEDWNLLPEPAREQLRRCSERHILLSELVKHGLLTEYQSARILSGKTYGLMLNNYRVLDRLGVGGMGVVFKAENVRMRRPVAIKVLALAHENDPRLLQRFFAEIRAIAQLQHPNIVAAMDAGETRSIDVEPALHYLVMEFVPGQDLEQAVQTQGPLAIAKACDVINQVAAALVEANRHALVHRDIKPSNIRVTPEGQAKLLDFGLARPHSRRLTEPGTVIGTLDFMAPEQASDSRTVDSRADIYGLGATLYWCLTGKVPFPEADNLAKSLSARLTQPPPSVRAQRPEIPAELDKVVSGMMAINPEDRFQSPHDVMRALLPFLKPELPEYRGQTPGAAAKNARQILVVDDEAGIRHFCRLALRGHALHIDEARDGLQGVEAVKGKSYDLVLLDVDMPGMTGQEVLTRLREQPPWPHLKIIMFSGRASADAMAQMMLAGADDYLTKPFSVAQLVARVEAALRLKEAQDRSALLNRHLLSVNSILERNLTSRDSDLVQARNALVLALAKLVEHRDSETGTHLMRLQRYARCLAEAAASTPPFANQIDGNFIDMLECCAPLHDIGKVALPDHILMKPGKLTAEERLLMEAHTVIGSDTLKEVARQHGFALAFLHMAADIARHHHERFDGTGYPDHLAGTAIPLCARLAALGDVYDALRSRRCYKPALSHASTMQVMLDATGQFDPALVQIFQRCATHFERIFHELAD
jgi:response regulator RpfG family c-di-GMP phosphodiesterase